MNRILGIVFLIVGVVLLVYGFDAANSVSSDVSRFFNGAPTDKSLGLLIGGVVCLSLSVWSWRGAK